MASTARTPRVQLVLNVRDEPQEEIVRVTAGHEVVEARRNGVPFLFKRKRSSAAPPAAQPHPPRGPAASAGTRSHLLRTPAGAAAAAQAATAAAAAESPYADELELPRALGQRLVQGMQQLAERAAPAERLAAIADSLGGAAVQEAACTSAARAAVLADVFAAFRARLEQALASGVVALGGGGGHQPPPAHDEGEVEQPGYQVDLQARKAGLRARLANFQKEEAEWQSLLQQVEALDQTQLAAAPPQLEQDAAREAGTAAAAGTDAGQPAAAGPGAEGAPAGAAAAESGELAALAAARTSLHRALALQVEGVCKLVGDVEEVVERANRSAATVQAEFLSEHLAAFPHVHSPARLIRELVRPAGGSKPAAAAAPDSKPAAAAAAEPAGGKENAAAPA